MSLRRLLRALLGRSPERVEHSGDRLASEIRETIAPLGGGPGAAADGRLAAQPTGTWKTATGPDRTTDAEPGLVELPDRVPIWCGVAQGRDDLPDRGVAQLSGP